ncbi:TPA: hypothetical protein MNJ48_004160 [Citrobacter freundii]|nr:hypothetical protein [Citrobacter freundii]HCA1003789.1 hypothetical protein [Citrobacter freundii]HCA1240062.1 hypothetical protein [Citrobacter freundii]HCA1977323.1 hypothetical protein [Citrobacter freundii]HCA2263236.1 hypothetical protein [Citrobacter freundii]
MITIGYFLSVRFRSIGPQTPIVFSLVEAGHDSTSENIVAVLRNGIAESGKWEPDQILYLQLAIDLLERGRGVPGAH